MYGWIKWWEGVSEMLSSVVDTFVLDAFLFPKCCLNPL